MEILKCNQCERIMPDFCMCGDICNSCLRYMLRNRVTSQNYRTGDNISIEEVKESIEHFNGKCAICEDKFEHLDHIHPVSRGGKTVKYNIMPLCAKCNNSKGNRTLEKMFTRSKNFPLSNFLKIKSYSKNYII